MDMKDKVMLAAGLLGVIVIAALIVGGMNQCADEQAKADEATSAMLLQQKDVAIAKLFKQVKDQRMQVANLRANLSTAEKKLDSSEAQLEGAKQKLDIIKEEVSSPIQPKTVRK